MLGALADSASLALGGLGSSCMLSVSPPRSPPHLLPPREYRLRFSLQFGSKQP